MYIIDLGGRRFYTDWRVAYDETPLFKTLAKYPEEFRPLLSGKNNIHRYYWADYENNLMSRCIIAYQYDKPFFGYNTVISVFGKTLEIVELTLEDICRKTRIKAEPPSLKLRESWDTIILSHTLFNIIPLKS